MKCYVFDLDGTLCNIDHRLHFIQSEPKQWDAFNKACQFDEPIPHMVELACALSPKIFLSGRSVEYIHLTEEWLVWNDLFKGGYGTGGRYNAHLYMRPVKDFRDDVVVKAELMDRAISDGWEPIMVFEDRQRVVDMWRARGVPCAQVVDGNY